MIEIEPLPETRETMRELRALGSDLQEKGVRSALHKAAVPIVQAMRTYAPDDPRTPGSRLARAVNKTQAKTGTRVITGAGRRHIKLDRNEVGLVIGPNKKVQGRSVRGIAVITEFGSKPHKISSKNNVLRVGIRGFIRGAIRHPGVRGQHWMGKAMESSGAAFDQLFYQGLETWMDKHGR